MDSCSYMTLESGVEVTPPQLPSGVIPLLENRSVPHRITMMSCNCTPYPKSKVNRCDMNPVSCNWGSGVATEGLGASAPHFCQEGARDFLKIDEKTDMGRGQ